MCTTIKNRGIKIAILYTEYLQLINLGPSQNITDSWYMSWVNHVRHPHVRNRHDRTKSASVRLAGLLLRRSNRRRYHEALTDLFIKVASSTASLTQ